MSSSAQQKGAPKGRVPVNPNDPHIQEVAIWAVNEYDKERRRKLVYKKTIKAEEEVLCGGTWYFIELEAFDPVAEACPPRPEGDKYFAKVVDVLACQHVTRTLKEFTPLNQLNARVALPN